MIGLPSKFNFEIDLFMFHSTKRVFWLLLAAYGAPLVIYLVTFGSAISSDHQRWAEFGSTMSGIYAPIVALTTLAVLLTQVGLQKQINDHSYDQAHFAQARSDIEFYTIQLEEKLDSIALPGKSYRNLLHDHFQPGSGAELDSVALRMQAAKIHAMMPSLLGMWFGVYPILAGLGASEEVRYRMTLHSSVQKLVALLSFETCVALDNFHRARTEGTLTVTYRFSPLLESEPTL